MPLVTLINAVGAKADMCVNDSRFLKEVVAYMDALQSLDTSKIAVVYKLSKNVLLKYGDGARVKACFFFKGGDKAFW